MKLFFALLCSYFSLRWRSSFSERKSGTAEPQNIKQNEPLQVTSVPYSNKYTLHIMENNDNFEIQY